MSHPNKVVRFKTFEKLKSLREALIENSLLDRFDQYDKTREEDKIIYLNFNMAPEFELSDESSLSDEEFITNPSGLSFGGDLQNETYCKLHIKNLCELLKRRQISVRRDELISQKDEMRKETTKQRLRNHIQEKKSHIKEEDGTFFQSIDLSTIRETKNQTQFIMTKSLAEFNSEKNMNTIKTQLKLKNITDQHFQENLIKRCEERISGLQAEVEQKHDTILSHTQELKNQLDATKTKDEKETWQSKCKDMPEILNILYEMKSTNLNLISEYFSILNILTAVKNKWDRDPDEQEDFVGLDIPQYTINVKAPSTIHHFQHCDRFEENENNGDLSSSCYELDSTSRDHYNQGGFDKSQNRNTQQEIKMRKPNLETISHSDAPKFSTISNGTKALDQESATMSDMDNPAYHSLEEKDHDKSANEKNQVRKKNTINNIWTAHKTALTDSLLNQYKEIKEKIATRREYLEQLEESYFKSIDLLEITNVKYQIYRARVIYEISQCERHQRELDRLKGKSKKLYQKIKEWKKSCIVFEDLEMLQKKNLQSEIKTWETLLNEKEILRHHFQEDNRKLKKQLSDSQKHLKKLRGNKYFLEKIYNSECTIAKAQEKRRLNFIAKAVQTKLINVIEFAKLKNETKNLKETIKNIQEKTSACEDKIYSLQTESKKIDNETMEDDIKKRQQYVEELKQKSFQLVTEIDLLSEKLKKNRRINQKDNKLCQNGDITNNIINNIAINNSYETFIKTKHKEMIQNKHKIKCLINEIKSMNKEKKILQKHMPQIRILQEKIKETEKRIENKELNFKVIQDTLGNLPLNIWECNLDRREIPERDKMIEKNNILKKEIEKLEIKKLKEDLELNKLKNRAKKYPMSKIENSKKSNLTKP